MHLEDFLLGAFVYLAAAVIAAPIATRLGLGSVLGYLVAGMVIGPSVLGLVGTRRRRTSCTSPSSASSSCCSSSASNCSPRSSGRCASPSSGWAACR